VRETTARRPEAEYDVARADLLVLVKHARPEVDPNRPSKAWTLGVEGLEGSLRLAERLRPLDLDLVVSSVEPKAAETARIVAKALDLPYQSGHDLHEQARETAGYLDANRFQSAIQQLFATPSQLVFGEETGDAAGQRFGTALDLLARAHPDRRLCVVAHGTVIALHLERAYDVDGWSTWKALDGLPCYVVVVRRTKDVLEGVRSG
jgi:broad specificity phosphatase PhoE